MAQGNNYIAVTAFTLFVFVCCQTNLSSQLPDQSKARKELYTNATCGDQNAIARRVGVCAKPVMDIIEGNLQVWPRSDKDVEGICESIHVAERCIRDEGRNCAQGLHKTIVSTVANSIQRARKKECAKTNLPNVLKLTQCIEKNTKETKKLFGSVVNRLHVVETMGDPIRRRNAACCTIGDMEVEMKAVFDRICIADSDLMVRLYKTVLEDVVNLMCRSAKCQDIFKGYTIPKNFTYKQGEFIPSLVGVIFSLSDS